MQKKKVDLSKVLARGHMWVVAPVVGHEASNYLRSLFIHLTKDCSIEKDISEPVSGYYGEWPRYLPTTFGVTQEDMENSYLAEAIEWCLKNGYIEKAYAGYTTTELMTQKVEEILRYQEKH